MKELWPIELEKITMEEKNVTSFKIIVIVMLLVIITLEIIVVV